MKAVNNYVLIDKIKEEQKTVAGLIITEKVDDESRYSKGRVISFGDTIDFLKEDDIVHYDKHAGHGVRKDDNLYYVIKVSDIVLID